MTTKKSRQWFKEGRLDAPTVKLAISLHQKHPMEAEVLKTLKTLPNGYVSRFLTGLIVKGFTQLAQENGLDIEEALKQSRLIDSALEAHNFKVSDTQAVGKTNVSASVETSIPEPVSVQNTAPQIDMPSEQDNKSSGDVASVATAQITPESLKPNAKKQSLSPFLQQKSNYLNQLGSQENQSQTSNDDNEPDPDQVFKL